MELIKILNSFPHKTVGLKETQRLIAEKIIKKVILAKDTDNGIYDKIVSLCGENCIELCFAESKAELGAACGISVNCACVGLF